MILINTRMVSSHNSFYYVISPNDKYYNIIIYNNLFNPNNKYYK